MKSRLLADATDIENWANRRDAQSAFPQLLRRLVHASATGIRRAGFRAGEGVQLSGWDGIIEVDEGNAFVPEGLSVWELTTGKSKESKADDDYAKRSQGQSTLERSQASFIFVTARRWEGKIEWAAEKKKDGIWLDVRAYDADDLEEWLEIGSAVHVWLSIHLGKYPEGAQDIETFWLSWSQTTRPAISADLITAGRKESAKKIQDWMLSTTVAHR